ncbi:MAG TPA: hypothetical protein VMW82_00490 [Candidatus Paceibacterota bacterium]|nr:hypothetical protein [Candidatus Paceibacterota bacterium]
MKNKKEFLSVLISVLICVFVFAVIVYATTTIGNNVTVGGTLTSTGLEFTLVDPPTASTASLVSTSSGNINNGTHSYSVTFVTATGETSLGAGSNQITVDDSHKQVELSNIPIGSSSVTQRKLYRNYYFLATLDNNTDTTYTDNISNASLGTDSAYLRVNTTGGKITVDGSSAGILTAGSTIALGGGALNALTTGYANIAIGLNTLIQNTTGYDNLAFGTHALSKNVSGRSNIAMGAAALYVLGMGSPGNFNVAVGENALSWYFGGSNNVAVGYGALMGNYNTSSGNVGIGYNAGYYETGSNKLFIDNATRASEADARLKALIYGIFAAATANQYLTINGQLQVSGTGTSYVMGNFGIGDTVPAYTLSVDGTASVSDTMYVKDVYFSGVVSASDTGGILIGEGITIKAGLASPSGACGTAGNLYTEKTTGTLSVCGVDGIWNPK